MATGRGRILPRIEEGNSTNFIAMFPEIITGQYKLNISIYEDFSLKSKAFLSHEHRCKTSRQSISPSETSIHRKVKYQKYKYSNPNETKG
jgi:hypothetical protein